MFSTTTDTGKKCDYYYYPEDNHERTKDARYFQTFKEPSLIKASTTDGNLWIRTEMSAVQESLSHLRAGASTCCKRTNILFLGSSNPQQVTAHFVSGQRQWTMIHHAAARHSEYITIPHQHSSNKA
jgi:hypothetical protein